MNLDIVIPTLGRREKLQTCINSIFRSAKRDTIKLILFFGEESELNYFKEILGSIENVKFNYLDDYRVPTFWNDYLVNMSSDCMCYLNDDIELWEDTLEIAIQKYESVFPDFDGVIGFNQVNLHCLNKVESAFGMIGKNYIKRFPEGQVWCPDYYRFFADYELWQYAKSINKFYFCEEAKLNHYHPITNRQLEDSTHRMVRKWLAKDKDTFRRRQEAGLLWGKSFELLGV